MKQAPFDRFRCRPADSTGMESGTRSSFTGPLLALGLPRPSLSPSATGAPALARVDFGTRGRDRAIARVLGADRCEALAVPPLSIAEDFALRQRIFQRLAQLVEDSGGALTRSALEDFQVSPGEVRRLIDTSRGIWNPRDLNATLAIVSSPDGPYADREVHGGWFRYDYRAGSIDGDNRKLREAMTLQLPLILLRKIATGVFVPIFPVYVVEDDQSARQFVVAVDETLRFLPKPSQLTEIERRFAERITKQRLHQAMFGGWSFGPTRSTALCVGWRTENSWTRRTSRRMRTRPDWRW